MAVLSARSWPCIFCCVRYVSRKKPPSSGCGSRPNAAITSSAVGRFMAKSISLFRQVYRVIAPQRHLRPPELLVHDRFDQVGLSRHEVESSARPQQAARAFDE